jgi:hypothetical protein
MPPGWFPSVMWPALAGLCRAKIEADGLSQQMVRLFNGRVPAGTKGQKRYLQLSRARLRLMVLIGNLSTRLRITHQQRWDRTQAANVAERASKYRKPWE